MNEVCGRASLIVDRHGRKRIGAIPARVGFVLIFFLLALPASWATSETAVEVSVPSADALESRLEALVEALESQRRDFHIPGMAIVVVKDDKVVLMRGFGLADVEKKKPVTTETLFAIGSTTKAFTATLIGMLTDEGKMQWDDPVEKHLPYFHPKLDTEDKAAKLTLRDLLSHRSGFARMGVLWASGNVSSKDILIAANNAEPWDAFRKGFHYNNVMYLAAGMAGAAAADTSWAELLEKRILEPLGMKKTNTSVESSQKAGSLALGYEWIEEQKIRKQRPVRNLDQIAPAGAINSNVQDMALWLRFLLAEGKWQGKQLIRPETLRETWSPQVKVANGVDYGFGWMLRDRQGRSEVEHGGNIDGFAAEVALIPEERIGFALLMNVSYAPLQQSSRSLVWDALLASDKSESTGGDRKKGTTKTEEEVRNEVVGEYVANFATFRDAAFTVSVTDGKLAVDVPGQMNYKLTPPDADGKRGFEIAPDMIKVSFDRDAQGRVIAMRLHQAGYDFDLPRKGVEIAPPVPLEKLEPYLGRFYSENLERDITVLIAGNRLALDVPDQMVYQLDPPDSGEGEGRWTFRIKPELSVAFKMDESGKVVSISHYRAGELQDTALRSGDAPAVDLPDFDAIAKLRKVIERSAAYRKASPLRMTGTVEVRQAGVTGRFEAVIEGSDRQRTKIDLGGFGYEIGVLDGDYAARESSFQPSERLSGVELRLVQQGHLSLAFGDWRDIFDKVELIEGAEIEGRKTWVVRLANPDTPEVILHLAQDNGDVLMAKTTVVVGGGAVKIPTKATYSDHRDVLGFRMPFRIITENAPSGRTVVQVESVTAHAETSDSFYHLDVEKKPAR